MLNLQFREQIKRLIVHAYKIVTGKPQKLNSELFNQKNLYEQHLVYFTLLNNMKILDNYIWRIMIQEQEHLQMHYENV